MSENQIIKKIQKTLNSISDSLLNKVPFNVSEDDLKELAKKVPTLSHEKQSHPACRRILDVNAIASVSGLERNRYKLARLLKLISN